MGNIILPVGTEIHCAYNRFFVSNHVDFDNVGWNEKTFRIASMRIRYMSDFIIRVGEGTSVRLIKNRFNGREIEFPCMELCISYIYQYYKIRAQPYGIQIFSRELFGREIKLARPERIHIEFQQIHKHPIYVEGIFREEG